MTSARGQDKNAQRLYHVAVAASFKPAMNKLLENYPDGHTWQIISGSSGKIASQIMTGAKFDLFLSADEERAAAVAASLSSSSAKPRPFRYAQGKLALVSLGANATGNAKPKTDFQAVLSRCEVVAIANPKHAPYGRAAQQVLQSVSRSKAPRVIMGQNVAQAAQFVLAGAAPCGLVALSYRSVFVAKRSARVLFLPVPEQAYAPIWQAGIATSAASAVVAFKDYILSVKGQRLIKDLGFGPASRLPTKSR